MGFVGLHVLAAGSGGESEVLPPGARLLFDGEGLLNVCLRGDASEYGGDYPSLDLRASSILKQLAESGFKVEVFLGGDGRRRARAALLQRDRRRKEWSDLEASCRAEADVGAFPAPRLAATVFDAALRWAAETFADLTIVRCEDEAAREMALACLADPNAVILGDSGSLLFRGAKLVQLDQLDRALSGLPVFVSMRADLASALGLRSEDKLVELALLMGDDSTCRLLCGVDFAAEGNSQQPPLTSEPEALLMWYRAEEDVRLAPRTEEAKRAFEFSRAFYELDVLDGWPSDAASDAADGSPADAASDDGSPAPALFSECDDDDVELRAVVGLVRKTIFPEPAEDFFDGLASTLRQSCTAAQLRALRIMYEGPVDASELGTPDWNDVVALYQIQNYFAKSGALQKCDAQCAKNVFHGPAFHAAAKRLRCEGLADGVIEEAPLPATEGLAADDECDEAPLRAPTFLPVDAQFLAERDDESDGERDDSPLPAPEGAADGECDEAPLEGLAADGERGDSPLPAPEGLAADDEVPLSAPSSLPINAQGLAERDDECDVEIDDSSECDEVPLPVPSPLSINAQGPDDECDDLRSEAPLPAPEGLTADDECGEAPLPAPSPLPIDAQGLAERDGERD
ncbi:hypothetical protein M885DRAFT_568387, partial [Pelagophyceae sp. CCMP2097]